MLSKLHTIIKPVTFKNKLICLSEKDPSVGVEHNWSSLFIKDLQILAKGEYRNPKPNERSARITLFNPLTGQIQGNSWF